MRFKIKLILLILPFLISCKDESGKQLSSKVTYWINSEVDQKILEGMKESKQKPILYFETLDVNEIGIFLIYREDKLFSKFTDKSNNYYRIKEKDIELPLFFDYQYFFGDYFNQMKAKPGIGGYTILIDLKGNVKDVFKSQ